MATGAIDADATVVLSILKSYENMGRAEVTCTSGCTCTPFEIDSHWDRRASVFMTVQFTVSYASKAKSRPRHTLHQLLQFSDSETVWFQTRLSL